MNIIVPVRSPKQIEKAIQFATIALLLLLSSCGQSGSRDGDRILARVGNETLTEGDLDILYSGSEDSTIGDEQLEREIDRWMERTLVKQEAEKAGFLNDPLFQRRMERVQTRFIADEYLQTLLESTDEVTVTDQEAQDYFQANRDRFELEEPYVRFRHLTAPTRREAVEARQALMDGQSWEEVARQYSVNAEERIQHAEQTIPRSRALSRYEILQDFLDVIGITEISPIQLSNGQYHFIQLMEERAAGESPDIQWLIEEIKTWLQREKAQQFINSYKRNLYLQAESSGQLERIQTE
ncbi:MAG: peptidyl-prolyl cis-trans isomerase [Bacteroidota bacterium]